MAKCPFCEQNSFRKKSLIVSVLYKILIVKITLNLLAGDNTETLDKIPRCHVILVIHVNIIRAII